MTVKIATCSYCGTRAALVLDRERHELACSSCGAPLHEMKALKTDTPKPVHPARPGQAPWGAVPKKARKPRKKKKSLGRSLFEEAFDLIEDIFD
ncbi:hypothetical protein [Tropicibacter sp. S64]|uniref:hypothetical protein n=1 Tax=Tropicibacter sp. S64 TaxID=3415122 RepID=UPI003C7CBDF6